MSVARVIPLKARLGVDVDDTALGAITPARVAHRLRWTAGGLPAFSHASWSLADRERLVQLNERRLEWVARWIEAGQPRQLGGWPG